MTRPLITTDPAVNLAARLRWYRLRLGWSQQNVADQMGHGSRSMICDLESGTRQPTLPTLTAWVAALGLQLTLSLDAIPDPPTKELSNR